MAARDGIQALDAVPGGRPATRSVTMIELPGSSSGMGSASVRAGSQPNGPVTRIAPVPLNLVLPRRLTGREACGSSSS
ncbi:hypothetical protein [Actinoplanes sp. NBRC 103695]|uniref:hypothetical protein n=1 Tax=Actinoplanes sp. NBRC 103695 TaxID=3032202 RepID=UPI0025543CC0|nr:hypothetical protein [Actinoplanes sp. NBRC 103695]